MAHGPSRTEQSIPRPASLSAGSSQGSRAFPLLMVRWFLLVVPLYGKLSDLKGGAFPFWDDPSPRTTMHIGIVTPLTRHGCAPSRYIAQRMAATHITQQPRDSSLCPAIGELQNDFQISYSVYDSNGNGQAGTSAVLKSTEMGAGRVKAAESVRLQRRPGCSRFPANTANRTHRWPG